MLYHALFLSQIVRSQIPFTRQLARLALGFGQVGLGWIYDPASLNYYIFTPSAILSVLLSFCAWCLDTLK